MSRVSSSRGTPAAAAAPVARTPATAAAMLLQYTPGAKKILKAHSGGGGGSAPVRHTGLPIRRPASKTTTSTTFSPSSTLSSTTGKLGRTGTLTDRSTAENNGEEEKEESSSSSANNPFASTSTLPPGLAPMDMPASSSSLVAAAKLDDPLMTDKQSLCIDILVAGHVSAFVDFFYLTHRAEDDSTNDKNGGTNGSSSSAVASHPPPIPDSKLPLIQQYLTAAEKAHRRGDSEVVFSSYEALANDFHASGDFKTSCYYSEKCLDLAESMEDMAQQCQCNLNLGLTHDAMGDTAAAIRFHEKHRQLAISMGAQDRIQTANQQLIEAYRRYAEEHERKDDNATAVLLYKRCLSAAQDANDMRSEGLALYRLGVACAAMGERNESIEMQQKYLHICKKIGDQLGEGAACAALAHSFKELGQTDLAVSYLEKYQAIAHRNKQSVAQAEACSALGSIHSAGGEHQQAVSCFEKTFEIARTVGDRTLIDSARINLGMARGNLAMSKYMGIVKDNLPALLSWKTRRQQFKQT